MRASQRKSPYSIIADVVQKRSRVQLSRQHYESMGHHEMKRLREVVAEELGRYNQEAVVHGYPTVKGPPEIAV